MIFTTNSALSPGIALDGAVAYTWTDTDPEDGTFGDEPYDDYNSLEIGIGTNFTF